MSSLLFVPNSKANLLSTVTPSLHSLQIETNVSGRPFHSFMFTVQECLGEETDLLDEAVYLQPTVFAVPREGCCSAGPSLKSVWKPSPNLRQWSDR